jgi:hypothetical protein
MAVVRGNPTTALFFYDTIEAFFGNPKSWRLTHCMGLSPVLYLAPRSAAFHPLPSARLSV